MAAKDLSKRAKTIRDRANEIKVKTAARYLMARDDRPGRKAIRIAPTIGRKIIVVRYGKSNYTDSFLSKEVETKNNCQNTYANDQTIELKLSGLGSTNSSAGS